MIDLSDKEARESVEAAIEADIDEYCRVKYDDGPRSHLGASSMGKACNRQLWSNFRWLKRETFNGRMQRLFQVGHMAEPRFVDYLRAIGFEVWERDPQTDKQFRISGVNGHYGGSLDGICRPPAKYDLGDLVFLNEFKTNLTGSGYSNVDKDGVAKAKPEHYKQMSQYGWHYKLKYGLYIIENKNDSDLTIKIVELDWKIGQDLEQRAAEIINSQTPPAKIASNPAYEVCKFCPHSGVCWYEQPVDKNCRSCRYAQPVENAEWKCNLYNQIIPKDFIPTGCDSHIGIV